MEKIEDRVCKVNFEGKYILFEKNLVNFLRLTLLVHK